MIKSQIFDDVLVDEASARRHFRAAFIMESVGHINSGLIDDVLKSMARAEAAIWGKPAGKADNA